MSIATIRAALIALVWIAHAPAQIVVDPSGGGAFTDLQAAIDAAPDGAVIQVKGGSYEEITISKSLTIVGDPAPLIAPAALTFGAQPPAIDLVGTGAERVTLAHIVVRGFTAFPASCPSPGIRMTGMAELRLYHARVYGQQYQDPATGTCEGAPAIAVPDSESPLLVIFDSHVEASDSISDNSNNNPTFFLQGAPSIQARDATLHAVRSTFVGGDGPDFTELFVQPPQPCPCPFPNGKGGDGLVVDTYSASECLEIPGRGGVVYYETSTFGRQASGAPFSVQTESPMGSALTVPAPMQLGNPWLVSFAQSGFVATAILAGAPGPRVSVVGLDLFVDLSAPLLAVPLPFGAPNWSVVVPLDPSLAGAELALQVIGAPGRTSAPAFELIRF